VLSIKVTVVSVSIAPPLVAELPVSVQRVSVAA
jgi:hypothetical protein